MIFFGRVFRIPRRLNGTLGRVCGIFGIYIVSKVSYNL